MSRSGPVNYPSTAILLYSPGAFPQPLGFPEQLQNGLTLHQTQSSITLLFG